MGELFMGYCDLFSVRPKNPAPNFVFHSRAKFVKLVKSETFKGTLSRIFLHLFEQPKYIFVQESYI